MRTYVSLILIFVYHHRFWKVGRHEVVELEDNPVCFEEGKYQLKFGTYFGVMCFNVREIR